MNRTQFSAWLPQLPLRKFANVAFHFFYSFTSWTRYWSRHWRLICYQRSVWCRKLSCLAHEPPFLWAWTADFLSQKVIICYNSIFLDIQKKQQQNHRGWGQRSFNSIPGCKHKTSFHYLFWTVVQANHKRVHARPDSATLIYQTALPMHMDLSLLDAVNILLL